MQGSVSFSDDSDPEPAGFDLSAYVSVRVYAGSYDSAEADELAFTPYLTDFTPYSYAVELRFDRPLYVSYGAKPDFAVVTLEDPSLFVDEESGIAIDPFVQTVYLPKMVDNSPKGKQQIEALADTGDSVKSASDAIVTCSLFISILAAASFKALWNLMNFAQVVFYLKHYSPNTPANMTMVYELLNSAINLTFIDYDALFGALNEWADEALNLSELAASFKSLGSDGASFTKNVGLYLLMAAAIGVALLALAILWVVYKRCGCARSTAAKAMAALVKALFYNSFLRTLITGSLNTNNQICVMLFLVLSGDSGERDTTTIAILSV
mmetsp:Transcript_35179/g.25653  ORF Transcript_35179/g.25653 Transcript_35179/m.25653 type:complete len:324 (+) Transcript_35179:5036-6007(+)